MEFQLDAQTLISVYQSKVSALMNDNIMLEAKNLVLTKQLAELSNTTPEVKSTSRKKAVDTAKDAGTY